MGLEAGESTNQHVSPEQAIEMFGPIPKVQTSFTVQESQVPPEFGHVTHPTQATIYFEEMMRIMNERGLGFQTLLENGVRASVLEAHAKLGRDLKVGDEIVLTTETVELEKQIRFDQAMKRGAKDISTHNYLVDLRGMRRGIPIDVPLWVSERLRTDINPPEEIVSDILSE